VKISYIKYPDNEAIMSFNTLDGSVPSQEDRVEIDKEEYFVVCVRWIITTKRPLSPQSVKVFVDFASNRESYPKEMQK